VKTFLDHAQQLNDTNNIYQHLTVVAAYTDPKNDDYEEVLTL